MNIKKPLIYFSAGVVATLLTIGGIKGVKNYQENHPEFKFEYKKVGKNRYVKKINGQLWGGISATYELNESFNSLMFDKSNTLEDLIERHSEISLDDTIKKVKIIIKK